MQKKIGLVEDDATMRSLLETLFKLEGYTPVVILGADIETMIQEVINNAPVALLIDVHLKNINGVDLTRQIRDCADLPQPTIVMASGMDHSKECIEAGADYFLLKPYLPQELIDWLNDHLPITN